MSLSKKYTGYIVALIIVSIFIYAGYTYFIAGQQRQGTELRIQWSTSNIQTVYDVNIPNDINYTKLWGKRVYFTISLNINEYSNKTNPEVITLQFKDKQSIRSWLNNLQIPNLLKNMLKAMFDMSREDFNREDPYAAFQWRPESTGMQGYILYNFQRTMDESNNLITVSMRDASSTSTSPIKVWDLMIKVPFTGTEYDLTFTRYPKI